MFVSPIIVWGLMAVLAVSVLVVLVLIARVIGFGLQKSLKGLAILLISYPALLGVLKIWGIFEWWVWLLVSLAVLFWALSGLVVQRTKVEPRLVNGFVRPVDSDLEIPRPSATPPHAPARPVIPAPAASKPKPKTVANPPVPAS